MDDPLKLLAGKIANDLRLLADACEKLGSRSGDPREIERAKMLLEGSIDNHWHGIVVGEGQIQRLLAADDLVEEPEPDLQEVF